MWISRSQRARRTMLLARKLPSTAQNEIKDMLAPGLTVMMNPIRLKRSPSSAPASSPLRAAPARNPLIGSAARVPEAPSGASSVEVVGGSSAGSPPLARK